MMNFIFEELKTNNKIKIFFNELLRIVEEIKSKWNKFDSKAIAEAYSRVNEEISLFNNDLNQVSH